MKKFLSVILIGLLSIQPCLLFAEELTSGEGDDSIIIVDDEDTVKLEIKPQKDKTVLPWEYICSQVEGFRKQKKKMK